jgi:ADP-heptose:LPS heptosyltransferase
MISTDNQNSMLHKPRAALWTMQQLLLLGQPNYLFWMDSGIGDDLMCSALFRELRKRGQHRLWMMTHWPELFANNPDFDVVLPVDYRYIGFARRFNAGYMRPNWSEYVEGQDAAIPPNIHALARMCQKAGVTGEVSLRPYFYLTQEERHFGRFAQYQVAIQSSGLSARSPVINKEWYPERFQQVVNALKADFQFVQIGSATDPLLEGVIDLRGKTTIRQTAGVLSNSVAFVGLEGFPMHLARAVDCPGVILFGGRSQPHLLGYICNVNLTAKPPCSPCWQHQVCDEDRLCMRLIEVPQVIAAVRTQAARAGQPLETATLSLVS